MNDELRVKNNELGGKMNYRYRNDEEMKDSGVEWLDVIPKSWTRNKLKRELKFSVGSTPSTSNRSFFEGENIWVTIGDLNGKYCSESKTKLTEEALRSANMKKVPKGSLLYSFKLSVGQVAFTETDLYTNEAIASFYPNNNSNLDFWYYALGNYLIENSNENIYGAKLLNQELINNANIFVPSEEEQKKIAKFLDEKTAQFDSIISKKEALIEKLEEAKKSLISEVVTGKVRVVKTDDGYELVERKKEEMKDSGVEWLGDIPKEWGIKKLKHISILNPSKSEVRKYLEEDIEVSFIPMDSVRLGYINIEQSKKISEIIEGYTYFKNDDIVMAKVTPCFENRNMAISDNLVNGIGFGSTELNVIRCIKKEDIEYLYYSLQEEKFINVATSEMTGAGGLKRVPSNFLINAQFAYPNTTKEKEKIIKYLNEKEIEIKYIIDKTKQQIEKLKEAKQSLISEVVTGKIEILD